MSVLTRPDAIDGLDDAAYEPVGPVPLPLAGSSFLIRLHDRPDELATFWQQCQQAGSTTVYQDRVWVAGIVEHLAAAHHATSLYVEVCDAGTGATLMILPLLLIRRGVYREITWCDLSVCDYAAPLVAPDLHLDADRMRALWDAVKAKLPPADIVRFGQIRAKMGERDNPLACLPGLTIANQSFGMTIDGPAETLVERVLSSSARRDRRKADRRIAAQGVVQTVAAETPEAVDAQFSELLAQRRRRFQGLGRFDLLERPGYVAFYRDQAHRGLRGGCARMFALKVGDTTVATAFGLVDGRAFHGTLLAMNADWRAFAPGLRIIADIMVWARRQGLDYFDFTVGALSYKKGFGATPVDLFDYVEPLTLRGRVVEAAWRASRRVDGFVRANPALFERLRTVRRAMRRAATALRGRTIPDDGDDASAREP